MTRLSALPALLFPAIVALYLLPGCTPAKDDRGSAASGGQAPTFAEASAVTLRGLEGDSESVTLSGGRWEGPPFSGEGAVRPSVYLVPGFAVSWNADAEGPPETVVLVGENSGGSGEYIYLSLIARQGDRVVNRATALLGDRVQVVSVSGSDRKLAMTILRAGPEGALCCPDEVASETWELRDGKLAQLPEASPAHPLTGDIMAGVDWILVGSEPENGSPGGDEPDSAASGAVTLRYADGRFQGNSGCNRYFMGVTPGELPGDLVPGKAGVTRMACPDSTSAEAEAQFLTRLGGVNKFGFSACRLMLMYEGEEGTGVLYFRRP